MKCPTTVIIPELSILTDVPIADPEVLPPNARAQMNVWFSVNFMINVLPRRNVPAEVRLVTPAPGSKSTVPINVPVTIRLPAASIAIDRPSSG